MNSQNSYVWIDDDVVSAIHETQIAEHGGALGVRDRSLLASALDRPRNATLYSNPDVAELAALYLLGIVKNHPFVDGNKRVGAVLLELFLDLNGHDLRADDEAMLAITIGVAAGKVTGDELLDWIRANAIRRD